MKLQLLLVFSKKGSFEEAFKKNLGLVDEAVSVKLSFKELHSAASKIMIKE